MLITFNRGKECVSVRFLRPFYLIRDFSALILWVVVALKSSKLPTTLRFFLFWSIFSSSLIFIFKFSELGRLLNLPVCIFGNSSTKLEFSLVWGWSWCLSGEFVISTVISKFLFFSCYLKTGELTKEPLESCFVSRRASFIVYCLIAGILTSLTCWKLAGRGSLFVSLVMPWGEALPFP